MLFIYQTAKSGEGGTSKSNGDVLLDEVAIS